MSIPAVRRRADRHDYNHKRCIRRIDALQLAIKVFVALQIITTFSIFYQSPHLHPDASDLIGGKAVDRIVSIVSTSTASSRAESFSDVRFRQIRDAFTSFGESKMQVAPVSSARENEAGDISSASRVLEDRVSKALVGRTEGTVLKSCFGYSKAEHGSDSVLVSLSDKCRSSGGSGGKALVVYNPHGTPRTWCGKKIPASGAIHHDEVIPCVSGWAETMFFPPPSIFDPDEDRTIDVILGSNNRRMRNVACDVPCRYSVGGKPIMFSFRIGGTNWTVKHTMEGVHYYGSYRIKPNDYLHDQYYATYSFKSEIPLPYFSWAEYNIKTEPVEFGKAIPGASFIARNCGSKNNREKWVRELQKYFRVDSLSSCLNNAKPPNGLDMRDKVKVMRQYMFHLAFENQIEEDYITEKLWGSLESGTVPVYLGSPNAKEHAPPGSIILAQDFPSYQALGEYLTKVAGNRTLYEKYHEWRKHDFPEVFVKKYNFTHIHSECRTCRWARAKKYGLGWDHNTQSIVQPALLPVVCADDATGLALRPFSEIWLCDKKSYGRTKVKQLHSADQCRKGGLHTTLTLDQYTVHRSVAEHDNVIDVTIRVENTGEGEPLYLRLETRIQNKGIYFPSPKHDMNVTQFVVKSGGKQRTMSGAKFVSIQDSISRFTVLADWATEMFSPQEGTIQILIHDGSKSILSDEVWLRRIRIVSEDQNKLHYNENEGTPSYFCTIAAKEFYAPLEFFYVDN